MYHEKTKHIDVRCHLLTNISMSNNSPDMTTNPIIVSKLKNYLNLIGICSILQLDEKTSQGGDL